MPSGMEEFISNLFDEAYQVNEELDRLMKKRSGIRSALRNFRDAQQLSEQQEDELADLFPPIRRKRRTKAQIEAGDEFEEPGEDFEIDEEETDDEAA